MNDTREWTMSDKPKRSVGETIKDLESENGKFEVRLERLEKWRNGFQTDDGKNVKGVNDQLDDLRFYFRILWVSASVLGTIASIILTWLLGKI